jgi:hypothetical protein
MNRIARAIALPLLLAAAPALAQVEVKDAWVRGTVATQTATGAFMRLTASEDARLVDAKSPVAGAVEIHEMRMDGNVMRMRAVKGLDLPAGRAVELKPGGYHVMLMELKQPLKEGESVPLSITVETKAGKRTTIDLSAPVKAVTAPASGGSMQHKH